MILICGGSSTIMQYNACN